MKIIKSLGLTLLPSACFGVERSAGGRFEDWHAKSQLSAPLQLDDASYEELTAIPRNHSLVVLLTALEARFGCQLCRDFQPEWDLVAKSWAKGDKLGNTRTLLGTLDFTDGKGTFQKVLHPLISQIFVYIPLIARSNWLLALAYVADRSHLSALPANHRAECESTWVARSIWLHCRVCTIERCLTDAHSSFPTALNPPNKSSPGSVDICLKVQSQSFSDHWTTFVSLHLRRRSWAVCHSSVLLIHTYCQSFRTGIHGLGSVWLLSYSSRVAICSII